MADTGHEHPIGSPILEAIPGDDEHVRATFTWRGEGERVALLGGPTSWKPEQELMLPYGNAWHRSLEVPRGVRTTYAFLPDPPTGEVDWDVWYWRLRPDPLNPSRFVVPYDEEDPESLRDFTYSVLTGPDAPAQPWIELRPDTPAGSTELQRFRSTILGNERRVYVYTPPGYRRADGPFPLLLVFDGWAYVHLVPTPVILDNLIGAGAIPPLVAVMPDSLDGETRSRELPCYPPFVEFLTDELLPWARERWNLTEEPAGATVAGSSFGGLAAVFAAFTRPDRFGNVLSQSGSFGWGAEDGREHDWLTNRIQEADRRPFRAYLDAGTLETRERPDGGPSTAESNRRLWNVLTEKGNEVRHAEFSGGHDYICWRGTLADGLVTLLGKRA